VIILNLIDERRPLCSVVRRSPDPISLPDRVTVLTCIGCGAMGRQERCDGACSEHKLELVNALEHHELLRALDAADARIDRLRPVVEAFADEPPGEAEPVLRRLRVQARRALAEAGRDETGGGWDEPSTVTGWWCAECGNVDMPQPCIGVCVWQPAEWVNRAVYERLLRSAEPRLRAARSFSGFVARSAAVTPRAGTWERNRQALHEQALAVLALTPPTGHVS
jgi:hypothetical protein